MGEINSIKVKKYMQKIHNNILQEINFVVLGEYIKKFRLRQ